MKTEIHQHELNTRSRQAGALYLLVVITGIFSLVHVPTQISVTGDMAATIDNMGNMESLFRWGIAAFIMMQISFLLLPLALFRLFRSVNETLATLMVILAVTAVPMGLLSLSHKLDALSLVTDPRFADLSAAQLETQVGLALAAYGNSLTLTTLFWGLWLLPFGYLVFTSKFLPRVFGILLMLGCFGYLINLFADLLWPGYAASGLPRFVRLPASLGEIGICLWMLIVGARPTKLKVSPTPA